MTVALSGRWTVRGQLPVPAEATTQIEATPAVRRLAFDTKDLAEWDSALLTFVLALTRYAKAKNISIDPSGLPKGMLGLVDLAMAVPPREGRAEKRTRRSFPRIVGEATLDFASGTGRLMAFIGEAAMSLARFATGRARFRRSDMWLFIEQAGVDALPIVSLLSLLQGLTMAFLGAAQLQMFGAQIFVANLVGMSMAARDRRDDGGDHHGRAHRGRVRRADRHDAGQRGDRCASDHGARADGLPRPAEDAGPDRDDAVPVSLRNLSGCLAAECLRYVSGADRRTVISTSCSRRFHCPVRHRFARAGSSEFSSRSAGCMQGINCGAAPPRWVRPPPRRWLWRSSLIIVGDGLFAVLAPQFPVGHRRTMSDRRRADHHRRAI